ncbi:hypothetical protein [Krasilnikovia sp. MM14-A1004]|uniref:hypothetical protein n=1 Tax=Krasilnikovia sp. MM14-A1004 TaxID=3373541 RepID=UPI00399C6C02
MKFATGPPSKWLVTLNSGGVTELAADGYTEQDGFALFSVLADVDADERNQIRVVGFPFAAPTVDFLVAKIPMSEVAGISRGGPWDTALGD